MENREQQLLQMGFKKNEHQNSYRLYKFDKEWYVDFWKITDYTDHKWNILIEDIKYDFSEVKKQFYEDVRNSFEYKFAVKENKKQIQDKYNHLNSLYQQLKIPKLDRYKLSEEGIRLEAQVELLQKLL